MTLSIPIPVVPIKLTIGKEKKEDAPTPVAAPVSPSHSTLGGGDIAIMCVTAIAIVAIIAIVLMSIRQQGA